MRIHNFFGALLTVALFSLPGCTERSDGSKVLAKVNGRAITAQDLAYSRNFGHGNEPRYGGRGIQDVIDLELLSQQGERLGLDRAPATRGRLVRMQDSPPMAKRLELARQVFNSQIASRVEVTPQEAREYYRLNAERMATELHLQWVKFAEKGEAEEARRKLLAGADFSEVARPVLKAGEKGGKAPWDLGFVKWEQVPVDFVEPIYRLKPGEVSGLLGWQRTGFQIVKLLEKRRVPRPEYQRVSATVMNRLRDLKLLEAYHRYLDTLRKEAKVVTF